MDESQNALLKTLEEPAEFAHLVLITSEPAALLETVISRCQEVRFAPLRPEVVEQRLGAEGGGGPEVAAAARLSGGDTERRPLPALRSGPRASQPRRGERAGGARRRARRPSLGGRCSRPPMRRARRPGSRSAARDWPTAAEGVDAQRGAQAPARGRGGAPSARRGRGAPSSSTSRSRSRARGFATSRPSPRAPPSSRSTLDRGDELRADAEGLDGPAARRAAELVEKTRRDLQVNVSEQLALEALVLPRRSRASLSRSRRAGRRWRPAARPASC